MRQLIQWVSEVIGAFPILFLEIWGRFAFVLGIALTICAFGGFTIRPNGRWGIGREQVHWDAKALLSIVLTIVLVMGSGYLGSFVVLVPGAQTLESLKDAMVFVCVVLFGYPAYIGVPIAYILSDIIEGVSPDLLWRWGIAFPMIPAFHWLAHQFFGKDPDFRKLRVWGWYGLFVLIFMGFYPPLWGYACGPLSGIFPPEDSYYKIIPALVFTLLITWLIAPFLMLVALPLARRHGLFWAEIPGRARERPLKQEQWIWESGRGPLAPEKSNDYRGIPIRVLLSGTFITLMLIMVGLVAFLSLRSGEKAANVLGERMHREIASNIQLQVEQLLSVPNLRPEDKIASLGQMLRHLNIARTGRAFLVDAQGAIIVSSAADVSVEDKVMQTAVRNAQSLPGGISGTTKPQLFRFGIVALEPFGGEIWLSQITPFHGPEHARWWVITTLPESDFLKSIREGNSRAAIVFTFALIIALLTAAFLADLVTKPLRRISKSARAMALGDLAQRVPGSRLEEVAALSATFNDMAGQIEHSFEKTRASEEKLRTVLDTSPLPISWMNSEGVIEFWNRAAISLFGYDPEEIATIGRWFEKAYPDPKYRKEVFMRWSAEDAYARGENTHRGEYQITCKDGRLITAEVVSARVGELTLSIFNDITERKLAEEELSTHRAHLEELVAARTAELEEARVRAEGANRSKSAFLANMSHEIRTPINAILGYAQLLRQDRSLSATQVGQIETINHAGEHLLAIINSVLEMSKIEAGAMKRNDSAFDLHDTLDGIVEMHSVRARSKGITLSAERAPELPRHIFSDQGKLCQILNNIIGNAVKFTSEGGICMVADVANDLGDSVDLRIAVTDTGPGIPPEELQKLFRPFVQSTAGIKAGGTGLGLSIGKEFAKLLGGDIAVTSRPGRGSTFTVTIRARIAQWADVTDRTEKPAVLRLAEDSPSARILVVDDEPMNRQLLADMLAPIGFEVRIAEDGSRAVEAFAQWKPQVVIMDMRMPVMDGIAATRLIRAMHRGRDALIIALSASAFEEERVAFTQSGADFFMSKPFRQGELLEHIRERLSLKYVYQEKSGSTAPAPHRELDIQSLKSLAPETRNAIIEACREADYEKIMQLCDTLSGLAPETAAAIRELISRYDYEALAARLSVGAAP